MGKVMVGFDIGASGLKIALSDSSGVKRMVTAPIPDHLVKEGLVVSHNAMADLIRSTARSEHLGGGRCAFVLPARQTFFRRVTMPVMTVNQLKVNLPYEFRDYITLEKEKYFYDYALLQMRSDESGEPRDMDLTAAAIPKTAVAEYAAMFRRAGFRLQKAAPVECAYGNLVKAYLNRNPSYAEKEICLIDLGHSATRIYIYSNGYFEASRIIDHGCSRVDQAIAEAFGVDEHIARTYKEANHNNVLQLEGAMNVYNGIAVEIRKAVNFYRFNHPDSMLQSAYLCGGGAKIQPLTDTIAATVDLQLKSADELLPPSGDAASGVLCVAAAGIAW